MSVDVSKNLAASRVSVGATYVSTGVVAFHYCLHSDSISQSEISCIAIYVGIAH